MDAERNEPPEKICIFRDVDALKVNKAVQNLLDTGVKVIRVLQSESPAVEENPFRSNNATATKNLLTITIFYKESNNANQMSEMRNRAHRRRAVGLSKRLASRGVET